MGVKQINVSLLTCGIDKGLLTHGQEVVDHDGDDRGSSVDSILHKLVCGVGVHLVEPFNDDENIHPAEKTVQDDNTGDDFSPEGQLVVEIDHVQALGADTHSHVDDGDDN